MSEQHLILILFIVIGLSALGIVAALANRPKTPEHDLRRRALRIVAGFGAPTLGAAVFSPPLVAVTLVVTCAAVVIAGIYLVLRAG